MSLPTQNDGRKADKYEYGSGINQTIISPKKLNPISFDMASPSTRFPAIDTTIMAKNMPVNALTNELDKMVMAESSEI